MIGRDCVDILLKISKDGIYLEGALLKVVTKENKLYEFRKDLFDQIGSFPTKQSSWCHVPLGRILEPCRTSSIFKRLCDLSLESQKNKQLWFTTTITEVKFIHEKQWYMNDTTLLSSCRMQ